MKRRDLLKAAIPGAIIPFSAGSLFAREDVVSEPGKVFEPGKNIPWAGDYDVVVCGSGPAGVTAAIESGRNGARTLLVELQGCLGGIWTAGLLSWVIDHSNKTGIMREIVDHLQKAGGKGSIETGRYLAYDVETMKLILEEMCAEAGVDILLHTRVAASIKSSSDRITHIITESKSGREAWSAKVFIDATGDGDLAALSGCGFDLGDPEDEGAFQPMSMLALVTGVNFQEIQSFVRWTGDQGSVSKERLFEEIRKSGLDTSYTKPGLYPVRDDLYMMMANHEYGYSALSAKEITKATLHARREVNAIVNGLRSLGGKWHNFRLVATAEHIGIREGRRIHGLYTISTEDLVEGKNHDDAVCTVTFGVDVHSVRRSGDLGASYSRGIRSKPYDIPLRALIAKDVRGLMMAGRCISGDFIAHSSYRVTGNAVPMGQYAGRVSAIAALSDRLPEEVRWNEVSVR